MRTAVDVHNFLVERELPHEMVSLRSRVRSPEHMAAALGLDPEQVGHVVLFEDQGGLVAALLRADRTVSAARLTAATGREELAQVSAERATDLTEFLPEAMPPVGLPDGTSAVMDWSLERQEVLYFPGGEATSVLKVRPEDLIAATGARVAQIARGGRAA